MQTKQLLLWCALTILLHWSEAQLDNIRELSVSADPEQTAATTVPSVATEVTPLEMENLKDKNSTGSESGDEKPEESVMGTEDMQSSGEHVDLGPQIEEKPPMGTENIEIQKEATDTDEPSKPTVDIPPAVAHTEPPMETTETTVHAKPVASEETSTEAETADNDKNKPLTEPEDYPNDAPSEQDSTEPPPATTQPTPATTKPPPPPPPTSVLPVPLFPSISCFSCNNCKEKPKNKIKCASAVGKRNGCLTLVKSKEKLVLRGCISELAETSNNYCKANAKDCQMCYENDCNAKEVTLSNAAAAAPLLGSALIWGIGIISCLVTM
ncbi:gibberellin-regulated protein 14 [Drosophila obscura]|uniref:gibberellin-regulated protein 14 n=1 Tax=Drosophila obscura TaxID=7282 RepID=UPI001BB0DA30|nr:gibberellin-regulated protein 14 [Drosophila obscura]